MYDIYAARENLQELVKKIPTLKNIRTKEELGKAFAKTCKGIYISSPKEIIQKIESIDKKNIIVIYSAGDIDFLVRKNLQIF